MKKHPIGTMAKLNILRSMFDGNCGGLSCNINCPIVYIIFSDESIRAGTNRCTVNTISKTAKKEYERLSLTLSLKLL